MGTLSEDQYWSLVDSTRQEVARLAAANPKTTSPDELKNGIQSLISQWSAVHAVALEGGPTVPVDNSFLLAALAAQPPDLLHVENILDSLMTAHKGFPSGVFSSGDLQSLQSILSRPEFRGLNAAPNPLADWFSQLRQRIFKWVNDLLQKLLGDRRISLGDVSWTPLGVISALVLVLLLIYVARSIFVDLVSEGSLAGSGDGGDAPLTSDTALDKAHALSRQGDYRSAVRYLYLSCLLLLDERGLVRYDHSKTNREVLRTVSDAPELAQPLREVIDVFDNVWYGYHSLDEESFQHYSRRVEELKEQKR